MKVGDHSLYLSTIQTAEALGVSVSTIKRWVDEQVLPAHKTAGGHRKLLRAEVLALARQGNLPHGDFGVVNRISAKKPDVDFEDTLTNLINALLNGHGAQVRDIIHRTYESGVAVETIADRLISPAMATIGHEWEGSQIDIWQEHRSTQLCAAALYDLINVLESRAERNRPIAIGAAPEGDPYLLPTLLVKGVLLDAGWDAVNLGPNTPMASLIKSLKKLKPRLIWLSVSTMVNKAAFLESYRELYRVAERNGVAVAIGGQALKSSIRAAIPYTTYGDGLTNLAAFARTLHTRPKPPRRGRPPRPLQSLARTR